MADRVGRAEEARGADRLEPHRRMGIGDLRVEQRHRVGDTVAPVAEHARRGGARPRLARSQHALQQRLVDAVVPLLDPERLHHLVLVLRAALSSREIQVFSAARTSLVLRPPSSILAR